jgi:glyoxylase-like metal-dependent hydrolase (beta-lactamase superfamily II)
MRPQVTGFFDAPTNSVSYLVVDPATRNAAIIDPVLDFDVKSGRTGTRSAQEILDAARAANAEIDWILETHVHADHLTASRFLHDRTGAPIAIGASIGAVQTIFRDVYNTPDVAANGSQFDRLLAEGDRLPLGELEIRVLHTPGHTPACLTYLIGDAAFIGDTLFMPDYGTARADFPGGDARVLYRSIRRILELPPDTRLFLCHDYLAPGRDDYCWETTVAAQRQGNVHVNDSVDESSFVAMRRARDATLDMPTLLLPAIQVNMRAGRFPGAESNGTVYLKLPIDRL